MTWIFPALAAGALLLLMGSKKKTAPSQLGPRPLKGQVWTLVMHTSRPCTAADWGVYIQMLKGTTALMGATSPSPNRYVLTLRYLQDGPRFVIGKKVNIGDDWMILDSATRAPIA